MKFTFWLYRVCIIAALAIILRTEPTFTQPKTAARDYCLHELPVQRFYEFDGATGAQNGVRVRQRYSFERREFVLVSELVTVGYFKNKLGNWQQVVQSAAKLQSYPDFLGKAIRVTGATANHTDFDFSLRIHECAEGQENRVYADLFATGGRVIR
ncbi:MAG: hypothetical protein R2911_41490 [Caldilineaceae bacterium]